MNVPVLAGAMGGLFSVLGGLYLLATQKLLSSDTGTEVEIKFLGRLKSNYPSLAAIFIGAGLLVYTMQVNQPPPRFPISGKITPADGDISMVAIVPNDLQHSTNTDGSFTIDVPFGQTAYNGIAYNPNYPPVIGSVVIKEGRGEFNADLKSKSTTP